MAGADDLRARLLGADPLLLDGALGTELERRGLPCELPLWSAHALLGHEETLASIHADYARAGAEILTANTFRTQERTLSRAGLAGRSRDLTRRAVAIAREAGAGHPIFVAGSAAPLEDCFRPDLVPDDATLRAEHVAHAEALGDAGVDLILVETMNSVREAAAATAAARSTGLPVFTSFVCGADARLLSGEALARGVEAAASAGADAVLINCLPATQVSDCLPTLSKARLPFGAYANLGGPGDTPEAPRSHPCSPAELGEHLDSWIASGASLVGGCCGTNPDHIRALRERLDSLRNRVHGCP